MGWVQSWVHWWSQQSRLLKILPISSVAAYWSALWLVGGLRMDHVNIGLATLALSYLGRPAWSFLIFIFPGILTVTIYDSMRFYSDSLRGMIRIAEPYLFDKKFFGIPTAQGVLTPNEWLQLHTHWSLDLISGFFYLLFVAIFVGISAYFYFWSTRRGTRKCSAVKIKIESPRMMWGFLWLNLLGYTTYYWYPAAPPWYVAAHGLGPADLSVQASAAGCLRFDQLLGTHFFTEMYGRAADVFGAIPSLHVAYPLLAVFFAFRFGALRAFSVFFYAIMCFSAVYLNHHYMLDILWGSAYAVLIYGLMNMDYAGLKRRVV